MAASVAAACRSERRRRYPRPPGESPDDYAAAQLFGDLWFPRSERHPPTGLGTPCGQNLLAWYSSIFIGMRCGRLEYSPEPQYSMAFLPFLHRALDRENLPAADARAAMACILAGEATTAQIAAFAAALRVKGETAAELQGLAQAMRDASTPIPHGITDRPLLDTCGTGGDSQGTINVSTIVAVVVAACGVAVAKHGNRSLSSQCGSADLLECWGCDPTDVADRPLDRGGFGFCSQDIVDEYAQPARAGEPGRF